MSGPEREGEVAAHYGTLVSEQVLLDALQAGGKDLDHLTPADLAPVDEFHIGGRVATADLLAQLSVPADARWLDLGSGIGGPARHIASTIGCHVTGVDLTEPYVAIARSLSARTGLTDRTAFEVASALSLPFDDDSFDVASLLHVGMNIADKAGLCAEAARVLRPGGTFVIYDVMRLSDGALAYPLPWASSEETSFVVEPAAYRAALEAAGFTVTTTRERGAFAVEFFRNLQPAPGGAGLNLVMGDTFRAKIANLRAALESAVIAPTEMFATTRS